MLVFVPLNRVREDALILAAQNRLSANCLKSLPAGICGIEYDRTRLVASNAHLGFGAFHRCHQAEYLDDLAQKGGVDAQVGINLKPPLLAEDLEPQDSLYTRTLVDGPERDTRLIGITKSTLDYSTSPRACLNQISTTTTKSVTLTVTEKGYCHIPATGCLDEAHPDVLFDISSGLSTPRSLPGFIVAALAQRRAESGGSLNLISCDNIPSNGRVLKEVVMRLAALATPDNLGWIEDNVSFPSTMVDRIVPRTTDADRKAIYDEFGFHDAAAVTGEPFRQWVIEDAMHAPRPAWEDVGVEIVPDVAGHERIKMQVLNAAQSMLALTGALAGHETTADAVKDAAFRSFVEAVLKRETLPGLPDVPGMNTKQYLKSSLHRISNTALRHTCHQIATDTSQKIRQRILEPLRQSRNTPGLEIAIAAWIAYLAQGQSAFGRRWQVSDPIEPIAADVAKKSGGNAREFAKAITQHDQIFGDDLAQDEAFADRIGSRTAQFLNGQQPIVVADYASR